jgi:hypothetical protein
MNVHDVSQMTADKVAELGATIVRVVYGWDRIEPECKGCFTWDRTDAWRDEARRTGRKIFGILAYPPRWANGDAPINTPPLRDEDWYDFVYATVDRYKDDVFLLGHLERAEPEFVLPERRSRGIRGAGPDGRVGDSRGQSKRAGAWSGSEPACDPERLVCRGHE